LLEPAFLPDTTAWWNLDRVAPPARRAHTTLPTHHRRRLAWARDGGPNQTEAAGAGGPEECERDRKCWQLAGRGRGNFSLLVSDCSEVRAKPLEGRVGMCREWKGCVIMVR
jgi:hypothetical protein